MKDYFGLRVAWALSFSPKRSYAYRLTYQNKKSPTKWPGIYISVNRMLFLKVLDNQIGQFRSNTLLGLVGRSSDMRR